MGYLNEDGLATLVGKVKGQVVQLTSAEYRNLPASKNSDNKTYFVTDEDYAYAIDDEPTLNSDNLVKSGGVYTYTSKIGSGTLSTTAQTIIPAINELDAAIDAINTGLKPKAIVITFGAIGAYGLETQTVDVSANPAKLRHIVGWVVSDTTFLIPIQLFFSDTNIITCRVTNFTQNALGSGTRITVYYV